MLTGITKSANELTEPGLEITMNWNFQEPRAVFPWMFVKLTPRDPRNGIVISRGLCAPEATNGPHQETWRITPSKKIPEGDYRVEVFFVDNTKRVWAGKSGQTDSASRVAFSPNSARRASSRAWKRAGVPEIDMAWPHLLSRRLNLGSALRGSPRLGHYVFAFVFFVRLIALARLTSSPFLFPSGSDMHFYDDWARQILHGRFTDHFAFYGLPLYAYLLAFFYKIFGYSPFVPGFLQACLDAGTATLLYKIAVRIFRNEGGLNSSTAERDRSPGCGRLGIFRPGPGVFRDPDADLVVGFRVLVPGLANRPGGPRSHSSALPRLWNTYRNHRDGRCHDPLPCSPGAGCSLPETAIRDRAPSPWVARGAAVALLFLGLGAGTAPCWMHNYFVARDPVFLSAHSGINLWLGNNPEATGYPHFPGLRARQAAMLKDSIDLAEAAAGRSLKRSEVSDYWSAKARAYIRDNFGAWLKLMGRKLGNFWNAFEYDDLSVIANLRQQGVLFPGPHFGIVAALALAGPLLFPATISRLTLGRRPQSSCTWPRSCRFLSRNAIALPRFPAFCSLPRSACRRCGKTVCRATTAPWPLISAFSWRRLFLSPCRARNRLFGQWKRTTPGARRSKRIICRSLRSTFNALIAYVPDNPETNFALGNLRLAQGNRPAAKSFYRAALQIDGRHKSALNNLGVLALEEAPMGNSDQIFPRLPSIGPS